MTQKAINIKRIIITAIISIVVTTTFASIASKSNKISNSASREYVDNKCKESNAYTDKCKEDQAQDFNSKIDIILSNQSIMMDHLIND